MIIYFDDGGNIKGKVFGRIHDEIEIKMDQSENGKTLHKLIIQWKPFVFWDREGNAVLEDSVDEKGNKLMFTADYEPDYHDEEKKDHHVNMSREEQDKWFEADRDHRSLDNYRIDVATLKLIEK